MCLADMGSAGGMAGLVRCDVARVIPWRRSAALVCVLHRAMAASRRWGGRGTGQSSRRRELVIAGSYKAEAARNVYGGRRRLRGEGKGIQGGDLVRRGDGWLAGRKKRRRRDEHRPRFIIEVDPFPISLFRGVRRHSGSYITLRVRPAVGAAWPRSGSLRVARPERLNFMRGQFRADGPEISPAAGLARTCQCHAAAFRFIWKADGVTRKTMLARRGRNWPSRPNLAGGVVQSARARGLRATDLFLLHGHCARLAASPMSPALPHLLGSANYS